MQWDDSYYSFHLSWLKLTVLFITIVKVVFVLCVRGGGGVVTFHRGGVSHVTFRFDGFRNLVVINNNITVH